MGGDRDGNPNVTADITRHVLLLSRWKATDLFLKDAGADLRAVDGGVYRRAARAGWRRRRSGTVPLSDEKTALS
jgi:hypothetical protein